MGANRLAQVLFVVLGIWFSALSLPALLEEIVDLCSGRWRHWGWDDWETWEVFAWRALVFEPVMILFVCAIFLLAGRRRFADRLFPAEANTRSDTVASDTLLPAAFLVLGVYLTMCGVGALLGMVVFDETNTVTFDAGWHREMSWLKPVVLTTIGVFLAWRPELLLRLWQPGRLARRGTA